MTIRTVRWLAASAMATVMLAGSPAMAQSAAAPISAAEAADLRAEIARLRAEVDRLSARLDAAPAPIAPALVTPVPTPPGAVIAAAPAPTPAPTSAPAAPSVRLRGRLQLDTGTVSAPAGLNDRGLGWSSEIRRAYLGVDGTITGGFSYRIEADFADNDVTLTDAYLSWARGDTTVTLGQHKSFSSFEDQSSDLFTSLMERAQFNSAFGFERRVGLSIAQTAGMVRVEAGIFTDDVDALVNDEANGWSVDGRVSIAPRIGDQQLHLGLSAHSRDFNDSQPTARYRTRPFLHSTNSRFVDTGEFAATGEYSFGVETAAIMGRLHWAGEAHWMHARRAGLADPGFFGGYAELGLFLTDDRRTYRRGTLDRPTVTRPVGSGGLGAWEVNARYDFLDLTDGGIMGGQQSQYGLSLVWHPVGSVRFTANYVRIETDDASLPINGDRDYGADAFGLRAQFDF